MTNQEPLKRYYDFLADASQLGLDNPSKYADRCHDSDNKKRLLQQYFPELKLRDLRDIGNQFLSQIEYALSLKPNSLQKARPISLDNLWQDTPREKADRVKRIGYLGAYDNN